MKNTESTIETNYTDTEKHGLCDSKSHEKQESKPSMLLVPSYKIKLPSDSCDSHNKSVPSETEHSFTGISGCSLPSSVTSQIDEYHRLLEDETKVDLLLSLQKDELKLQELMLLPSENRETTRSSVKVDGKLFSLHEENDIDNKIEGFNFLDEASNATDLSSLEKDEQIVDRLLSIQQGERIPFFQQDANKLQFHQTDQRGTNSIACNQDKENANTLVFLLQKDLKQKRDQLASIQHDKRRNFPQSCPDTKHLLHLQQAEDDIDYLLYLQERQVKINRTDSPSTKRPLEASQKTRASKSESFQQSKACTSKKVENIPCSQSNKFHIVKDLDGKEHTESQGIKNLGIKIESSEGSYGEGSCSKSERINKCEIFETKDNFPECSDECLDQLTSLQQDERQWIDSYNLQQDEKMVDQLLLFQQTAGKAEAVVSPKNKNSETGASGVRK